MIVYTVAEVIGGFLGMIISYMVLGQKIAVIKPNDLTLSGFYVFFLEATFTTIMMLNILFGKNSKLSLFSNMVPGVFGTLFGIYFCIGCIGKLTGALMNPNLGLCNILFCAAILGTKEAMPFLPALFFGPYIGSLVAAIFVKYVALKTADLPKI